MILYGYPLPLGQRNTLCPGAGGKARLFSPSPCSRGVASETRGCGGLVPRKAFSFGNLSQSQANRQSWAKPGRSTGEPDEARRSTGELGEARAHRRRAGRSQGEPPESWAKPGRIAGELGEARRSTGEPDEARANRRRAGRSQANRLRAWRSTAGLQ